MLKLTINQVARLRQSSHDCHAAGLHGLARLLSGCHAAAEKLYTDQHDPSPIEMEDEWRAILAAADSVAQAVLRGTPRSDIPKREKTTA